MFDDEKLVLVIEDDRQIADILMEVSELCEYQTEVIGNGREAIERFEVETIPDIVFLDLHLPEVSGLEFLRKARDLPGWKSVVIVVVTGDKNAVDELAERGPDQPRPDYTFLKPFHLPELLKILNSLKG